MVLVICAGPRNIRLSEATQMKNRKWRDCITGVIFTVSLFAISACTSQTVKMIQLQTGATAECSGSSVGIGPLFSESFVDSCARVYENRGYVALQRLTPEERADLERRGLLPKD